MTKIKKFWGSESDVDLKNLRIIWRNRQYLPNCSGWFRKMFLFPSFKYSFFFSANFASPSCRYLIFWFSLFKKNHFLFLFMYLVLRSGSHSHGIFFSSSFEIPKRTLLNKFKGSLKWRWISSTYYHFCVISECSSLLGYFCSHFRFTDTSLQINEINFDVGNILFFHSRLISFGIQIFWEYQF